jgi:hypothetical protein
MSSYFARFAHRSQVAAAPPSPMQSTGAQPAAFHQSEFAEQSVELTAMPGPGTREANRASASINVRTEAGSRPDAHAGDASPVAMALPTEAIDRSEAGTVRAATQPLPANEIPAAATHRAAHQAAHYPDTAAATGSPRAFVAESAAAAALDPVSPGASRTAFAEATDKQSMRMERAAAPQLQVQSGTVSAGPNGRAKPSSSPVEYETSDGVVSSSPRAAAPLDAPVPVARTNAAAQPVAPAAASTRGRSHPRPVQLTIGRIELEVSAPTPPPAPTPAPAAAPPPSPSAARGASFNPHRHYLRGG